MRVCECILVCTQDSLGGLRWDYGSQQDCRSLSGKLFLPSSSLQTFPHSTKGCVSYRAPGNLELSSRKGFSGFVCPLK